MKYTVRSIIFFCPDVPGLNLSLENRLIIFQTNKVEPISIPQPPAYEQETSEDCPIVQLSGHREIRGALVVNAAMPPPLLNYIPLPSTEMISLSSSKNKFDTTTADRRHQ